MNAPPSPADPQRPREPALGHATLGAVEPAATPWSGQPTSSWRGAVAQRLLLPVKLFYVSTREFIWEEGLGRSSALAYTTLLSLIPLAVVVLSILGGIKDKNFTEDEVVDWLWSQALWDEEPLFRITSVAENLAPVRPPAAEEQPDPPQPTGSESGGEEEGETLAPPAIEDVVTQSELERYRELYGDESFAAEEISMRKRVAASLTEFVKTLRSNFGTIGLIGAIVLVISAISLFNSIETNLNGLWHIQTQRNLVRKFLILWALLTLGPILLAASFVLRAQYLSAAVNEGLDQFVLPYSFTLAAFFLLYRFVPNTRVNTVGALVAAVITGLLWELSKLAFAHYVAVIFSKGSTTLTVTYGSLALVPIFLMWLYLSWALCLFGVKLCYVWQHMGLYSGPHWSALPSTTEAQEFLAIRCMEAIVADQYRRGRGLTVDELASRLQVPQHRLEPIVASLTEAGMILEHSESRRHFGTYPPDKLTVEVVTRAVRGDASYAGLSAADPAGRRVADLLGQVDERRRQLLGQLTLAELHASMRG